MPRPGRSAGPERGWGWQHLHELLLSELRGADLLDFSRAAVDASHIRAMKGGPATGPSSVDRGKAGSKHHLIVEAGGIPLAAITTGGNRDDIHHAFVTLGCAVICRRLLRTALC